MSLSQFLAMQVWFNFSAVMPIIEREWGLTSTQLGIIIAFFQIGYVAGIVVYSILLEKYNPKYFMIFGALISGISGIVFAIFAHNFWIALLLRFISGIGIAGIYVPGMRVLTGIFEPQERGRAFGIYVGSLVFGSGFSLLISSLFVSSIGWKGVILVTSLLSIIASFLIYGLKIPNIEKKADSLKVQRNVLKKVFKKRNLLVNVAYAGHSWELYAMWAWIGPFLVYYFKTKGYEQDSAIYLGNMVGAVVIMIGGLATYIGGRLSDSIGRVKSATMFLFISIFCTLSIGWLSMLPIYLMLTLVLIYGFTIVADSPIYNVTIVEVADPEVLGIALGVQSVLGYTVTAFSPLVFGVLLDVFNWGMAFTVIGLITLVAPLCMIYLNKVTN